MQKQHNLNFKPLTVLCSSPSLWGKASISENQPMSCLKHALSSTKSRVSGGYTAPSNPQGTLESPAELEKQGSQWFASRIWVNWSGEGSRHQRAYKAPRWF